MFNHAGSGEAQRQTHTVVSSQDYSDTISSKIAFQPQQLPGNCFNCVSIHAAEHIIQEY